MLLHIDFASEVPIYMQIRNQIVMGIADGILQPGEKLPTIRALADEIGINMMTVNKSYQILKQEGFIIADRRSGATVCGIKEESKQEELEKLKENVKLIISEARLRGTTKEEFLKLCNQIYDESEVE